MQEEIVMRYSVSLLLPLTLLLAACAAQPATTAADTPAVGTNMSGQLLPAETVIYDTVTNSGVLKAVGQNVRVGTPTTKVVLSARISSATPILADIAVFGVRREGTENRDIGSVTNYTIGSAEQTFTASGTFPAGNYTFWFAYLKDGVWHETDRRAFVITTTGQASVPVDPVAASENTSMLKFVGSDTKKGLRNAPVRFAANLANPTNLTVQRVIFAVRDANDKNFDVLVNDPQPTVIGSNLNIAGEGYFPAGTYRYWVAYQAGGQWVNLGTPRSFVIETPPAVPVPPGASWVLNPAASDEFSGSTLDTAKWKPQVGYPVSGVLAFNKANATVSGGLLNLWAKKESNVVYGKTYAYTAGVVESLFSVPAQPSYVEVRAKVLDSRANVLSAIWLQNFDLTPAQNPNPEIDIQETFDYSKLISTLHTWRLNPDGSLAQHIQLPSNLYATGLSDTSLAFHTYGLERRDGWLRFYFDGKLAWEIRPSDPAYAAMSRHVILSLEGHITSNDPSKPPNDTLLPRAFQIDYVRTYTPR